MVLSNERVAGSARLIFVVGGRVFAIVGAFIAASALGWAGPNSGDFRPELRPQVSIEAVPLLPKLPELQVSAASAVILDAETGRTLWAKDPSTPRYPASTTKILTTLLLLEQTQPTDLIAAPIDVEEVGESSMHLRPGELVSARDLAYAMMLRSANDACYAVAVHLAGSQEAFSEMMNVRAREIGCESAQFRNPHGLNDPQHKVSALDLALIGREAMRRPDFREIVRTQKWKLTRGTNQEDLWVLNKNKWLKKDATADGIKTGWTIPAGKCYVGSATRNGFRVITVVLKSEDWQADHQKMLNWAFAHWEMQQIAAPVNPVSHKVEDGTPRQVRALPEGPAKLVVRRGDLVRQQFEWDQLQAPVEVGEDVGQWVLSDSTGFQMKAPLLSQERIEVRRFLSVAGSGPNFWVGAILAGGLIGAALWMRGKSRRFI